MSEQIEKATAQPEPKTRPRKSKHKRLNRHEFYEQTYIAWIAHQGVMAMGNLRPFCSNLPKAFDAYEELMDSADSDA